MKQVILAIHETTAFSFPYGMMCTVTYFHLERLIIVYHETNMGNFVEEVAYMRFHT